MPSLRDIAPGIPTQADRFGFAFMPIITSILGTAQQTSSTAGDSVAAYGQMMNAQQAAEGRRFMTLVIGGVAGVLAVGGIVLYVVTRKGQAS